MRLHLQSHVQTMELVARAGDVTGWRQENLDRGYGMSPRAVAAKRAQAAAEESEARDDA